MTDKITNTNTNAITKPKKFGLGGLSGRLEQAKKEGIQNGTAQAPEQLPNRIALLLDCSGSMASAAHDAWYGGEGDEEPGGKSDHTPKIQYLKQAVDSFIGTMNPGDTAAALRAFGIELATPLTNSIPALMIEAMSLRAEGGTPMCTTMHETLNALPITRAVLVSDGESTDGDPIHGDKEGGGPAWKYKEAGVPVDCVHIGDSKGGEETLKKIAEITGGIFMKFKDAGAFARAFKYLTPSLRLQLTAGNAQALTGADEVR